MNSSRQKACTSYGELGQRRRVLPHPTATPYNSWLLATKSTSPAQENVFRQSEPLTQQVADHVAVNSPSVSANPLTMPLSITGPYQLLDSLQPSVDRSDNSQLLLLPTEQWPNSDCQLIEQEPGLVLDSEVIQDDMPDDISWSNYQFDISMDLEGPFGFGASDRPPRTSSEPGIPPPLAQSYSHYDKRTLLYSLQALTLYSILLGSDTHRFCDDLNFMLVIATGEIAAKVYNDGYLLSNDEFPSWSDWIYTESRTRMLILLHLLEILFDIRINRSRTTPCSVLDSISLPSTKRLWQADTESIWEAEYRAYLATRKSQHGLKVGHLRKSRKLDIDAMESDLMCDLLSWSRDLDSFGSTLLMAVSEF
ncbi:hypothetical protein B7463_g5566, partial [Scytalidium lignicola]